MNHLLHLECSPNNLTRADPSRPSSGRMPPARHRPCRQLDEPGRRSRSGTSAIHKVQILQGNKSRLCSRANISIWNIQKSFWDPTINRINGAKVWKMRGKLLFSSPPTRRRTLTVLGPDGSAELVKIYTITALYLRVFLSAAAWNSGFESFPGKLEH